MSKIEKIWSRLADKEYRDAYLAHSIGDRIAAQLFSMRSKRGWIQADLAEQASMRQPRISVLERSSGEVSLKTLTRIASAFDVALVVKFVPFSQFVREITTETVDVAVPGFEADAIRRTVTTSVAARPIPVTANEAWSVSTGDMRNAIPVTSAGENLAAVRMATPQGYQERLNA